MSTQMIIRIDSQVKSRLNRLARVEGKTTSELVRGLIDDYIREKDIGTYIDDLWDRIGKKLRSRGVTRKDIPRVIKESRRSR